MNRQPLLAILLICATPMLYAQLEPNHPRDLFNTALTAFEDGRYLEAIKLFKSFEDTFHDHPSTPEARYYRAEALLAIGDEQDAIPLFNAFVDAYPDHPLGPTAKMTLGRYLYEKSDFIGARQAFLDLLNTPLTPELMAEGLYWTGMSSIRLNQTDVALDYFDQVNKRFPESKFAPLSLYMLGKTEIERDNPAAAISAFDQLTMRYQDSEEAHAAGLALIEANYKLQRFPRVIQEAEKRLPSLSGADLERAVLLLGESSKELGQFDQAQYYFEMLLTKFPNSIYNRFAYYGLGWTYHKQQQYTQAGQAFAASRGNFIDNFAHEASYNEGVNYLLGKQYNQAVQSFISTADKWRNGTYSDEAIYQVGALYYEQQNWEAAATYLDRLTREYPASSHVGESLLMLGECFASLKDYTRAIRTFDRALQSGASTGNVLNEINFRKAWLLYQNKNYAEASVMFKDLYQRTNNGDALFWAAECSFQLGNTQEAEQLYDRYVTQFGTSQNASVANYALGWVYFKQAKYAAAATTFEKFVRQFRADPAQQFYVQDAQLRIGDSYYAQKKFDDAVLAYRRVSGEGTIYALYQIGHSYMNSSEFDEALITFRNIVGNYPTSQYAPEAQYSIGYLYLQKSETQRARTEFQKVLQNYPNAPQAAKAQYGIGDTFFNEGMPIQAINAYIEVLNRFPNSPIIADALQGIQYAAIASGDPSIADDIIRTFETQNPNASVLEEVKFSQAETKVQSGQNAEAITLLESFIRTYPSSTFIPGAFYNLGIAYTQMGNTTQAEYYFKQTMSRFPSDDFSVDATLQLGELYLTSGRFQDSISIYRNLETSGAGNNRLVAEGIYGQAVAYLALGNESEGERLLIRLVSNYGTLQESRRGKLRLANLYQQTNRLQQARSLYEDLTAGIDEITVEALFRLGTLANVENKPLDALSYFEEILTNHDGYIDWVAQSLLEQARIYLTLGRKGDALLKYDILINEYDDTPYAAIAQAEKQNIQ